MNCRRGMAAFLALIVVAGCSGGGGRRSTNTMPPITAPPTPVTVVATTPTVAATTTPPSTTTTPPTTTPAPAATEPPLTLVQLTAEQQPETIDEIRALLASAPSSDPADPDAVAVRASVEGALNRSADGSLSDGDYFLGTGDFVPEGVVLTSYLVCPLSLGEHCAASVPDYQRFATDVCGGAPIVVSLVQGANGPAGAGTCWWRPTPEEIAAAQDLVRGALVDVVPDGTWGAMSLADEAASAAQAYAEFRAAHPFEPPLTSDVDGAAELRAALQPVLDGNGSVCDSWWFVDRVREATRADHRAQVVERLRSEISTYFPFDLISRTTAAGVGSAIGSGQLVVAWCVYGTS